MPAITWLCHYRHLSREQQEAATAGRGIVLSGAGSRGLRSDFSGSGYLSDEPPRAEFMPHLARHDLVEPARPADQDHAKRNRVRLSGGTFALLQARGKPPGRLRRIAALDLPRRGPPLPLGTDKARRISPRCWRARAWPCRGRAALGRARDAVSAPSSRMSGLSSSSKGLSPAAAGRAGRCRALAVGKQAVRNARRLQPPEG